MPKLTINNNTYDYPDPGSEPGWGADATGWAEDVNEVVSSLAGTGTIVEQSVAIQNAASNVEIPGLVFGSTTVQGTEIAYTIVRSTTTEKLNETGILEINFDASGPQWKMSRRFTGSDADTKVTLNITGTATGQVTYTSTALSGTGYVGNIRFKTISTITPT